MNLAHEREKCLQIWQMYAHPGYESYLVCVQDLNQPSLEWPGIFYGQIQETYELDKAGKGLRIIARSPIEPSLLMMYFVPRRSSRK